MERGIVMRANLHEHWSPVQPSSQTHAEQSAFGAPCAHCSPQVPQLSPLQPFVHRQGPVHPLLETVPLSVSKSPPLRHEIEHEEGVRHMLPLNPSLHLQMGALATVEVITSELEHVDPSGLQSARSQGPVWHWSPLKPGEQVQLPRSHTPLRPQARKRTTTQNRKHRERLQHAQISG